LLQAYFSNGQNPESYELLLQVVSDVGLDANRAKAILASDEFADAVREREQFYLNAGIHSVPAIIINDKHLISGGQPVEVFEKALRHIAAEL
jgi:predicted DsbA family dithiol-disulfide isomerase